MNWAFKTDFEDKKENLLVRSKVVKAARAYFDSDDFTEVQTPVLQICPVIDAHIHGFKTVSKGVDLKPLKTLYLQTSPEFDMKKLLAAGMERIYQICPVFRNGEASRLHTVEFTMLEWYRAHANYTDIMNDCVLLLRHICRETGVQTLRHNDGACDPFKEWQKISVRDAFLHYADIDLDLYLEDKQAFAGIIQGQGIRVAEDDGWDDLFFRVMAEKIEPFLGFEAPSILYDYPASMASLSRRKKGNPDYAERFELYACGVELANAFSELTDAEEQLRRYHVEMDLKEKLYGERYPLDEDFLKALQTDLPESGGIALGIDRLVMLLTAASNIDGVQWVCPP